MPALSTPIIYYCFNVRSLPSAVFPRWFLRWQRSRMCRFNRESLNFRLFVPLYFPLLPFTVVANIQSCRNKWIYSHYTWSSLLCHCQTVTQISTPQDFSTFYRFTVHSISVLYITILRFLPSFLVYIYMYVRSFRKWNVDRTHTDVDWL